MMKSRRIRWAAHHVALRDGVQGFGGKQEGKRPLGRPRRRWDDNVKMDLREIGRAGMDWIHLAQDMDHWKDLVNAVENLWFP
jgi:hypothetical protein